MMTKIIVLILFISISNFLLAQDLIPNANKNVDGPPVTRSEALLTAPSIAFSRLSSDVPVTSIFLKTFSLIIISFGSKSLKLKSYVMLPGENVQEDPYE